MMVRLQQSVCDMVMVVRLQQSVCDMQDGGEITAECV